MERYFEDFRVRIDSYEAFERRLAQYDVLISEVYVSQMLFHRVVAVMSFLISEESGNPMKEYVRGLQTLTKSLGFATQRFRFHMTALTQRCIAFDAASCSTAMRMYHV